MTHSAVGDRKRVVLGKIGKAHGTKGWLKLHSYTTPPENILEYSSLQTSIECERRTLLIDESRLQSGNVLVHFTGVDEPESARTLTGSEVWVQSSDLPALEEGEFYWHELEGMLVWNKQGLLFGSVSKLMETGANDVLVVAPTSDSIDERERLIPYLRNAVIKEVDISAKCILIDWDATYPD